MRPFRNCDHRIVAGITRFILQHEIRQSMQIKGHFGTQGRAHTGQINAINEVSPQSCDGRPIRAKPGGGTQIMDELSTAVTRSVEFIHNLRTSTGSHERNRRGGIVRSQLR